MEQRITWTALALALAATTTAAQSVETTIQVQSPVRNGGTLDWATGTWKRQSQVAFANAPGAQTIYNNTCAFTGGQMFVASEDCWDRYDDGRIPTTVDPFDPGGLLCDCYLLCGFEIGYCTSEAPGNVRVQVGFYEGLAVSGVGGFCTGFQTTGQAPSGGGTPLPPGNLAGPRDLYFDLSNVALPADPGGGGTQNCWVVTIDLSNQANGGLPFCGNGDVVFDNQGDLDLFNWVWRQRGTTSQFGPTGPLQAGDPIPAAPGSGTFAQNPGFSNVTGTPCGTGLGNADNFWINVDGVAIGDTTGVSPCGAVPAAGTNCYFFGGWPFLPYSGLYLQMFSSSAACADGFGDLIPIVYCTAKASSSGCLAEIGGSNPLAMPVSGADDYDVVTTQIEGLKAGIFFYGISGPAEIPFSGGTLCVNPQLGRTPVQFSNGSLQNCDGSFSLRINDGTIFNLDLGPGTSNWIQTWYRDPQLQDGFNAALSNAVQFDFQ